MNPFNVLSPQSVTQVKAVRTSGVLLASHHPQQMELLNPRERGEYEEG